MTPRHHRIIRKVDGLDTILLGDDEGDLSLDPSRIIRRDSLNDTSQAKA